MADEEKQVDEEAENPEEGASEETKKKLPLKLIGGIVGLVAGGGILAMVALPKKEVEPKLEGPFHATLIENAVPFSTRDKNNTRYVKFALDAEFRAYDAGYVTGRSGDPFFASLLQSRIGRTATSKTIAQITEGVNQEVFAEELRAEVEPIVFPIHVGETANPLDKDPETGLRPGVSRSASTFRGRFYDHVLRYDGVERSIQIDDGPAVTFGGEEEDLLVETAQGELLYLDVTHHEPEFVGEIHIGTRGHLRRLILRDVIAQ